MIHVNHDHTLRILCVKCAYMYPHVRAVGGSEVMVKYGSMLGQHAIACCDATELSIFLPQIEGHYAYS